MLREGTARLSESPWSSALYLVPKKDNGRPPVWRIQSSKRTTIQDRYPIRHIHEYSHQIAGCTIFSTIDLVRAYHHISVQADHVQKTDIPTLFGLFKFQFMSFDLRNAAKTIERFVDEVLSGFEFCFAYIDDILVYSRTPEEYEQHLRTLFKQLQAYGILFKPDKCVFSISILTPLYV